MVDIIRTVNRGEYNTMNCARPLMSFAPHQITDTGKQEYTLHIPLAESRKVGSERRAVGAVLPAGRAALRNPKRLIPCSLAF